MLRPLWHVEDKDVDPDMSTKLFRHVHTHPELEGPFLKAMKTVENEVDKKVGYQGDNLACPCGDPHCDYGNKSMAAWNAMTKEYQERAMEIMNELYGFLHGQQVVVQARLAYDDDMRRGSLEGPWEDRILIDGRDIWEFTLQASDGMINQWLHVLSSFRNLGRNVQPRCWPWTLENTSPYEHRRCDCPLGQSCETTGPLLRMNCLGPFGCEDAGHSHKTKHSAEAA